MFSCEVENATVIARYFAISRQSNSLFLLSRGVKFFGYSFVVEVSISDRMLGINIFSVC